MDFKNHPQRDSINLKNLQLVVDLFPAYWADKNRPIKKFNIQKYGGIDGLTKDQIKENECDTVACFLGNVPFLPNQIFKPVSSDFLYYRFYKNEFNYMKYCKRIFGFDYDSNPIIWDFLFDSTWVKYHPDVEDALERAKVILSGRWNPYFDYEDKSTWTI